MTNMKRENHKNVVKVVEWLKEKFVESNHFFSYYKTE